MLSGRRRCKVWKRWEEGQQASCERVMAGVGTCRMMRRMVMVVYSMYVVQVRSCPLSPKPIAA